MLNMFRRVRVWPNFFSVNQNDHITLKYWKVHSSNLNMYGSIILSTDFCSMPLSATLLFISVKGATIFIVVVGGNFGPDSW